MHARLFHSKIDLWLLGGIPFLVGLALWLIPMQDSFSPVIHLSLILLSYPHFASSYYAFYRQKAIWKKAWFPALAVPLALSFCLMFLLLQNRLDGLRALAQCSLALLYWHYLKQSYGCCIWLGKVRGDAPQLLPRKLLLITCLLVGSLGFLAIQRGETTRLVFGLYLDSFNIPAELVLLFRALTLAALVLCCIWAVWNTATVSGAFQSLGALLPLLALWLWFEPYFQTPLTLAILPALHGLQYLPFVGRTLWNEHRHMLRPRIVFAGLWILLMIGGYVGFYLLPRSLAAVKLEGLPASLLIFLNVHHYFIDASMWRLSRPEVRARLLGKPALERSLENKLA